MKPSSSKYDIPLIGNKELISEGQCESDESDDNENNDTACIVCNQLWRTYKGKKSEPWLICDICDGYMSKCSPPPKVQMEIMASIVINVHRRYLSQI